jgi:peptidoglycan/xylan/chitin deacetylase (PgdA/CDA1 family)
MKPFILSLLSAITLWANAHIFVYHRFGDERYSSTNTSKEDLRTNFEYLKTHGYKVVSLEKLVQTIKEKKHIPDKWVVLTIDDNFKSFYNNGLDIFKEYGYTFSLFIYVEATVKKYPDYLTWDELREVSKYGSLEFHTYAHGHLTEMSNKEIKEDFKKGLALLESHLHIKPKFFTYPYGEFSERVKKLVESYGFKAIINQNIGAVSNFSDTNNLDRIALVGKSNLPLYIKYKTLNAQWILPNGFPKSGIIKKLHVRTREHSKKGQIYLSGYGWEEVPIKDGNFNLELNKKLIKKRSRVIVAIGNKISTKLLIKDSHGIK